MTDIDIFVGVVRTYHDKEQTKLKEEYFVNAGKREGSYKSYHDNGQLWQEVNYINGLKHGSYKSYHNNGQIINEVNYINDKMNGIYKLYYYNGQLFEKVNYIDSKKSGIHKYYKKNGLVYKKKFYKDNNLYKQYIYIGKELGKNIYIKTIYKNDGIPQYSKLYEDNIEIEKTDFYKYKIYKDTDPIIKELLSL